MNFEAGPGGIGVSNIPVEFRQVPVHKNDDYLGLAGKTVIIPADTIKLGPVIYFSPSFGPEVKIWRFKTRAGVSLVNLALAPKAEKEKSNEGCYPYLFGFGNVLRSSFRSKS